MGRASPIRTGAGRHTASAARWGPRTAVAVAAAAKRNPGAVPWAGRVAAPGAHPDRRRPLRAALFQLGASFRPPPLARRPVRRSAAAI